MSFTYSPSIVKDGLVFYLDAANPKSYVSGETTTSDLISNINGTLENGVGFSTDNSGNWGFDGTDDQVNMGHQSIVNFDKDDSMSIVIWCNTSSTSPMRVLSQMRNAGSPSYQGWLLFQRPGGVLRMQFISDNSTGNKINVDSPTTYNDGTWKQFVWTYNGNSDASGFSFYVNGVEQSLVTVDNNLTSSTVTTSDIDFLIGARDGDTAGEFNGQISNVKIYNRTLSQSEITRNYNALKGRFGL